MEKIYTQNFNSKFNWRAYVLYPVSLFCAACMILVLSSFGAKGNTETEPNEPKLETVFESNSSAEFEVCCSRTIRNTVTDDQCEGNSVNYVLFLANSTTSENRRFKGTDLSWEECDNGTARFTGIATHGASGQSFDIDVSFSGGTSSPPAGSPNANNCVATNGLFYYTSTDGTLRDRATGETIRISRRDEAFQLGNGGNVVARGFGASGWLRTTDSHFDIGDINIMLGTSCTQVCTTREITVNNNGSCPIDIYRWRDGGDVYETTIAAGADYVITTEEGYEWRATDAPDPDFRNLLFDESYVSTDACDQVWNLTPRYCDLACTPNCRTNDPCDAVASYSINNINPTCAAITGGSGILFQRDCVDNGFAVWESTGDVTFFEYADGSAKIEGTVTNNGQTGHLEICLDQRNNTGVVWSASCYQDNLSGTQVYYNCFAGTIRIGGRTETIHKKGANGQGFIIGNGAGNNGNGLGIAGWASGSFGTCVEFFGGLSPIDPGCCDAIAVTGTDVEVCAGEEIDITATVTGAKACNGNTNNQYTWSGPGIVSGANTATATVNQAGTYTVVVTDCTGCEATDEVIVGTRAAVDASASNDGPITCLSPSITITALPNGNSYSWSGPGGFTSNQQSAQVGSAGTYTVTVTSSDGCVSTAETIVEVDESAPDAAASNDGPICDGGAVQIFGSSNTPNVSYSWTGEGLNANQQTSANNTIPNLAPGSYDYVLTVTNNENGCTTTTTTTVVITANPDSGISAQEQVCAGEEAQFSAVPPVTGATYAWTFTGPATPASANTAVATVVWDDVPGNYTATLTVENNGCVSTFVHEITVTAEVRANAGPDQTICQGGIAVLDASDSQGNGYLWTVVNGDPGSIDIGGTAVAATVSPLVTTTYRLQVDDVANNCTRVDEVTVFVDVRFNPIADAGGPTITICEGDIITLDGSGSLPPPAEPGANISYFWSPAQLLDNPISATPNATISETTTFELIVSTENGCRDTATVEIIVEPCDVALEKTVSNASPNVGETVTFTITATNEGNLPLTGIEIQDNVPNGYSNITNISAGGAVSGTTVTWSAISLPASGSSSVSFDAVVGIPGAGVDFKNTAQITAMDQLDVDSSPNNDDGDQSEDDEDSAEPEPQLIDLSLIKSVSDATPSIGDVITFSITVANAGPSNATNVMVGDAVPAGYTNISSISNSGTANGSSVAWSGLSIAANSSVTLTFDATVAQGDPADYVNIAQVMGADQFDVDSTPGNGADTNGNGIVGSEDPDGSQDPDDEDDGDDAGIIPNGSIWGAVLEDTDDNGSGDVPIEGVTITLRDATGAVVATAVTDADGKYDFLDLAPGNYTVEQTQPAGFDDVSDEDGSPDGDAGDSDTTVDNSISVTVGAGEADMDNDFVEELLTSIWGDVTEDTDGDGQGDAPIEGVTITLLDAAGNIVGTAVTDADGKYDFINLPAGTYTVQQTQPEAFRDVSDQDESPDGDAGDSDTAVDNSITVTTVPGEADMDNDFVEEGLTSIWGDVTEDVDDDGTGDLPIAGVTIRLLDSNGGVLETTMTDADGKYDFVGLPAGDYMIQQIQPTGFADVSDQDESPDGDAGDSDTSVDNLITVTTTANEADMDNDFVEVKLAEISGTVKEDTDGDGIGDAPIPGVTIELLDNNGNVIATAVTDAQGFYNFPGIAPGTYKLNQIDLPGFEDLSDTDTNTPAGDTDGANDPQDDMIPVVLTAGEFDDGNDFVEVGLTSIWGDVTEDIDGDGIGDEPISGVTITLRDASGNVIDTDVTDQNGLYDFTGLLAGNYTVEQTQPDGFADVSDQDESPDGDAGDSDTTVDNSISVTTGPGESDMDNDFVEEKLASISGSVLEDTDNDGIGDRPLPGVTVELRDAAGNLVATQVTGPNGEYEFLNIPPGNYTLVQVQDPGFVDVSDEDGSPDPDGGNDPVDNEIPVVLTAGENDDDNDFIDAQLVSIGSTVFEDANNNGTQDAGEPGISGINVAAFEDANADGLPDSNTPAATDVTDANGLYYLGGLTPGKYVVVVQSPAGLDNSSTFVGSDNGVDGDNNGSQPLGAGTPATSGTIMLVPDTEPTGESGSGGNQEGLNGDQDDDGDMTIDFGFFGGASIGDFVWFDINGNGTQDPGEPGLQGVTINLLDSAGNLVATTTSGNNGEYSFAGIAPGDYIVEFVTPATYTEVVQVGGTTPGNGTTNSDYNPATGQTAVITVNSGDAITGIDGGFNLILEVNLTSFTGRYNADRDLITLDWITTSELNADYFIIERAFEQEDFVAIARVTANGTTAVESLYDYDDSDIDASGVYTYRLIQVANDGSQEFSDMITINVRRALITDPSVNVYPNPVLDLVNLEIVKNEEDEVSVRMFDLSGKSISINSINIVAKGNSANIQIPVQDLPRAAYVLRINVGDQVFAKKITLVK